MIFAATLPDEVLIPQCLTGSEQAWSVLTERYRHLIHSISNMRGLPCEDAANIFRQVCLILVLELPRLPNHRRLMAWLIRVTSRECTRWRRKEHPAQSIRELVDTLPSRCRQLMESLFLTTPAASYDDVARRLGVAGDYRHLIRKRCIEWLRRLGTDQQGAMTVMGHP